MPEIKHNFIGGKMNKDLDERLIPNGEYRDAMNIQVSTSEGSNVGTVQNILGNELGCTTDITPLGSVTVGSIADEKNDALYWLVSGPSLVSLADLVDDPQFILQTTGTIVAGTHDVNPYYIKDMIMRKTADGCEPVFVDQWAAIFPNEILQGINSDNNGYHVEANTDTLIFSNPQFLEHIKLGTKVFGASIVNGVYQKTPTQTVTNVGDLYQITLPYYTSLGTPVYTNLVGHGNSTTITGYGVAQWVLSGGGGSYVQVRDVVFITDISAIGSPGLQVGDVITSTAFTIPVTIIGYVGNYSGGNLDFVGGAFYRVDYDVSNYANSTAPRDLNTESGTIDSNILLHPGIFTDEGGGDTFTFTIDQQTIPFTNEVNFPSSSQWLNEISDVFYDTKTGDWTTPTPKLKITNNNTNWPNITNACLTPQTPLTPPSQVFFANADGSEWNYASSYDVVDCDSSVPIFPTGAITGQMTLVQPSGDAFGNQVVTIDNPLATSLPGFDYLYFYDERTLRFTNKNITGINIIDDMLFWVDGKEEVSGGIKGTEPKKINIKASISGTHPSGDYHTKLLNTPSYNTLVGWDPFASATAPPIKEEHITVIRKAPKSALHYDLVTDRVFGQNYSGVMTVASDDAPANLSSFTSSSSSIRDFGTLDVGDVFKTDIATNINEEEIFSLPWKVGTVVVLKEYEDDEAPQIPFAGNEYRIKGVVVNWPAGQKFESTTGDPAKVAIKITAIQGFPPQAAAGASSTLNYAIDTYFNSEKLFEFKFPRFSYRYKYKDGEVSTYAPFTGVVFAPGAFNYHPTKGYNLGMQNALNAVNIKGFITQDMPEDVIAIDLLYKEDASPNVYTVDTIKPNSQIAVGETFNNWDSNSYKITSETIHAVVPSNQLLRPWDSVPRKVLTQEVTGNRLVYGNYLQGYNLISNNKDFYPEFKTYLSKTTGSPVARSIKSLRDYQLGVVFTDKYGRETPVIVNTSGAFKVPKSDARTRNALSVGFTGAPPQDLEYFKFFIKETSGQYYNLAMDRFFNAEDGNFWLSFPSTERNKIDEDTFLILKKGHDSKELVTDKARYKILAIANEAPDFIKTSEYNIGQVRQGDNELFVDLTTAPRDTKDNFTIVYGPFSTTSASNLHEITDELYVEFALSGSDKTSNRYRITELTRTGATTVNAAAGNYNVKIDGVFGNDVDFISSGNEIISEAVVRFFKYKVENKSIFDGRFFVKILNDDVFTKNISKEDASDKEYVISAEKKVYFMSADHLNRHGADTDSEVACTFKKSDTTFGAKIMEYYNSDVAKAFKEIPRVEGSIATSDNWYKYETYFKNKYNDNTIVDPFTGDTFAVGSAGSLHTKSRGTGLEAGTSGSKVFEDVMFIDKGTFAGQQSDRDYLSTGSLSSYNSYSGIGIANSSSYGRMDLSFGSLEPEDVGPTEKLDTGFYYTKSWEGKIGADAGSFWNLSDPERSKYNSLAPIYDKIQSGQQFRWKEDPTQTVYTIYQQVINFNINRFDNTTYGAFNGYPNSNGQNPFEFPLYWQNRDSNGYLNMQAYGLFAWDSTGTFLDNNSNNTELAVPISTLGYPSTLGLSGRYGAGTPYTLASNFQHKKRFYFTPAMVWDPTMNDSLGTIDGGAVVDKYVTNWSDPVNNQEPLLGFRESGAEDNTMVISADLFNNTFDSLNEIQHGLEGMLLTTVNGTGLTYPVLVDTITSFDSDLSIRITFKGYQRTTGAFTIDTGVGNAQTVVFQQPSMNGLSVNSANNINDKNPAELGGIGAVGYTIEFIEAKDPLKEIPANPAIWETEPKESTDLDIYYEISGSNPIRLNTSTIKTVLPVGSSLSSSEGGGTENLVVATNSGYDGTTITVNEALCAEVNGCGSIDGIVAGTIFNISKGNKTSIEIEVEEVLETFVGKNGFVSSVTFKLKDSLYNTSYTLDWHNCYSFGNGVESNRIRDTFNLPFIANGVKASTTLEENYKEEHRKYGLIYSGIYNSNSGVNNLNQFIAAEKITKDINPIYGSIQKLHSRSTADGDLIVLCEDKVLKILANKDALFNADGDSNITSTNNVLGQTIPFSGEYGISKNPESFASESYRVYFADKVRGAIIRLSKDGLTPISDYGMKDWFRDNLKLSTKITGSYDDRNDEYNITLDSTFDQPTTGETVTFKEDVKGWVSFKSFTPEKAISCANSYYTFKQGTLWKHYSATEDRNTFYKQFPDEGFTPSSLNVIINESPGVIKTFHTLNYEGTQSKIKAFNNYTDSNGNNVFDNNYYNIQDKPGWKVISVTTDQEEGSLSEFIEKEGKWFNYIKGKVGSATDGGNIESGFDNADFSFQGLGTTDGVTTNQVISGCTDDTASNYNTLATLDDGSCIAIVNGCTDNTAGNYDATATIDDGSCIYFGCTDSVNATNYNPLATNDDGSCTYNVYGCTDNLTDIDGGPIMNNYNGLATTDCNGINGNDPNFSTPITGGSCDGINPVDNCCCVPIVYGCMDSTADNYDATANVQQFSYLNTNNPCVYIILGCMDPTSCSYNSSANTDDGSCNWCNDVLANNYDGVDPNTNLDYLCDPVVTAANCLYCNDIVVVDSAGVTNETINIGFAETWGSSGAAAVDYYELTYTNTSTNNSTTISNIQPNLTPGNVFYEISGLTPNTGYEITVQAVCVAGTSPINLDTNYFTTSAVSNPVSFQTLITVIDGCTDSTACNYNANANNDDGSCEDSSCAGCTDSTANNYDATATLDDGSCTYDLLGCTDANANNTTYFNGVIANVDDGSCTYDVIPGCTDDSLANDAVTIAALNYNPDATVDDESCIYQMPTLYYGPTLGGMPINQPGWYAGGLWGQGNTDGYSGGSYRKIRAYWDVSKSPKIDKNNLKAAYFQSHMANTISTGGDITQFNNQAIKKFSIDGGDNFPNLNNHVAGDPIQLIQMDQTNSTLSVPFLTTSVGVDNALFYPPHVPVDEGAQKQAVQFHFEDANIPMYQTDVAEFNVYLGCDDPTFNAIGSGGNYSDNAINNGAFFDTDTCENSSSWNSLNNPSLIPSVFGSIDAGSVTTEVLATSPIDAQPGVTGFSHSVFTKIQWQHSNDYFAANGNQIGGVLLELHPAGYRVISAFTTGDGVVPDVTTIPAAANLNDVSHMETSTAIAINGSDGDPTGSWLYIKIQMLAPDGNTWNDTNPNASVEKWIQV